MLGILSATFCNFRQIRSSYSVRNVTKYFCCGMDGSPIRAQDWISSTRQAIYVWQIIEALSHNYCCGGQVISIPYSECVLLALVIRHTIRMRRIVSSSMSCLALPYFFALSHEGHDFQEKKRTSDIKRAFWLSLQLLSEIFLVIRIIR